MFTCYYKKIFAILLLVFAAAGCADENPALVYQPPQTETIRIRLLNLAPDGSPRTLLLNGVTETQAAAYGALSPTVKPPADSALISIRKNGANEFESHRRTSFVRNSNYTIVALPANNGSQEVDTFAVVQSLYGLTENLNTSHLKFLNAFSDTSYTLSVNMGCQSGTALFTGQPYLMSTFYPIDVSTGTMSISLSKNHRTDVNKSGLVGLFNIDLEFKGQYTLIAVKGSDGEPELWLLNDLNTEPQALTKLAPVPARVTRIRSVNFSTANVQIKTIDEIINSGLQPDGIDSYKEVGACKSDSADVLMVMSGSIETSRAAVSLEVLANYTVMVFDTAGKTAAMTLVAPPVHLNEQVNNRAIVRVVHGSYARKGYDLTVSLGARDASAATGYHSGDVLATSLSFGKVSDPVLIEPGRAPVTLFTATQPAQLIMGTVTGFESNKNYLVVVSDDPSGKERVSIIEETTENQPVTYQDKGVLAEVVNLVSGAEIVNISIAPGVLQNARVNSTSSVATILEEGAYTVTINGKQADINASIDKKLLVVGTGTASNTDALVFNTEPMPIRPKAYSYKFINAANGTNFAVRLNSADGFELVQSLAYGEVSRVLDNTNDKKLSLFFLDLNNNNSVMLRVNELPLTFGKNYSIILGRNSRNDGYTVVVQQEF